MIIAYVALRLPDTLLLLPSVLLQVSIQPKHRYWQSIGRTTAPRTEHKVLRQRYHLFAQTTHVPTRRLQSNLNPS